MEYITNSQTLENPPQPHPTGFRERREGGSYTKEYEKTIKLILTVPYKVGYAKKNKNKKPNTFKILHLNLEIWSEKLTPKSRHFHRRRQRSRRSKPTRNL